MRHVVVMGCDAIDDHRILAIASGHLHAELDVCALVLVCENLSHVMQQGAATRESHVESKLSRHDAGEPRHLLRVMEDVLAITRPPPHAADELDYLLMQSMDTACVRCALTSVDDPGVDFLA